MILTRLAVRRPVTTAMFFFVVILAGMLSFSKMKLAWLPTVDFPFVFIWAPYPNASPSYVERYITRPIEEQLAAMGGYQRMHSSSEPDGAEFQLEYPWGQKMDTIRMRVSERLDRAMTELPEGMMPIRVFTFDSQSIPIVEARISAEGEDLSRNYNLIDQRIIRRIQRVPGVAKVDIGGIQPMEVQIQLRLDDIYRYKVPMASLIADLRAINNDRALGLVEDSNQVLSMTAIGRMESFREFEEYPILGGKLKVKDIADVTYEQPRLRFYRHVNGRRAVSVEVFKESTANTVAVATRVKSVIDNEISKDPKLKGINFFTWNDQAKDILDGLKGLLMAGIWGALLAALVLGFFLRHPVPTLMVSLSIPFSLLMAGIVLFTIGMTLNMLTMMGLMIAVGMLVDNCIVVLEAITRRIGEGEDPVKATLGGADEVGVAVTAATLTTVIVFLPLVLGGKGEIFLWLKDVGVTVTITILCSLVVALTLIPFLFGRLKAMKWRIKKDFMDGVRTRYQNLLASTLRHRWRMFFIAIAMLVLSILPLLTGWVKMEAFKGGTKNTRSGFRYIYRDHFPLNEVEKTIDRMETYLEEHREEWEIETIYSWMGEQRAGTILNFARNLTDDEAKEVRKTIRENHPPLAGMELRFWHQDEEEGGHHVRLYVNADSMETVQDILPVVLKQLETVDGMEDVHSDLQAPGEEIVASLEMEKARRIGITPLDLSRMFAFTLGSQRLHRYQTSTGEVEVRFALREEDRENVEDLKNLLITSNGMTPIRLGEVATFQTRGRPTSIERENRKVGIGIRGTYEGEDFAEARKEISSLMDAMMTPGVSWSYSSRMQKQEEEGKEMLLQLLLALVLIYCVMASLFESFSHPFSIVLAMPYALFGVTWFFLATGSPLNIMAQIGLLVLMGIVVNNGIVFLARVNQLRDNGMERDEALVKGGGDRFRPIVMTAATTIVGLAPLAIGKAAISGAYYYPLARTVIGGLLTSTFLTLLILPYIYTIVDDTGKFLRTAASKIWSRIPFIRKKGSDLSS